MKKTPLYGCHVAAGAKMAPFAGYEMPIQYKNGIISEHQATRNSATVFDTCHMGEFVISGTAAVEDLENLLSCPIESIAPGQCRYGFLCNEQGGVIDDLILYRKASDSFFMVVNAATEADDFKWVRSHVSAGTTVVNISADTAKIDLQGPASPRIASELLTSSIADLKYYRFMDNSFKGEKVLVSRTGYTGEIGFELYASSSCVVQLWEACLAYGALPAGLGARDTLRLEMGYPLYGHELDTHIDASWSGFSRALGSKNFIGSSVIGKRPGAQYILSGLSINGRRTAHAGNIIVNNAGVEIGRITSGSFAPSLGHAVALGYIDKEHYADGADLSVVTERGTLNASVTGVPFYHNATARKPMADYR